MTWHKPTGETRSSCHGELLKLCISIISHLHISVKKLCHSRERTQGKYIERLSNGKELTRIEGGVTRFTEKSWLDIIHLLSSPCKVTMTMSS